MHRDVLVNVSDCMTAPVITVGDDESLFAAASLMRQHHIGALPVRRQEGLVGIITDRDIAVRASASGRDLVRTPVRDAMTPQLHFVGPDFPLPEAERLMRERKVRRLAVIDGDFNLVGILSSDDLPSKR